LRIAVSHEATADTEQERKRYCREILFSLSALLLCGSMAEFRNPQSAINAPPEDAFVDKPEAP